MSHRKKNEQGTKLRGQRALGRGLWYTSQHSQFCRLYSTEWYEDWRIMHCKGWIRKKAAKPNRGSDPDLNRAPPEYKPTVLLIHQLACEEL